jgi:hypothetical protein
MAPSQVDNREAAKSKPEWAGHVIPFVIGPSMDESLGHRFDIPMVDRLETPEVKLSANTAHVTFNSLLVAEEA